MYRFGQCDLSLLADFRRQSELLAAFIDERPHLKSPQPRGQTVADTLQGVGQLYCYLDAVGSELADPATDRDDLKARGRDILSDFAQSKPASCAASGTRWSAPCTRQARRSRTCRPR